MAPIPTERTADPTLMLTAEPMLPPAVLEGPDPVEVPVPVGRLETPEEGGAPLEVGRAA